MKTSHENIILELWKKQPQSIIEISKNSDMMRGWASKGTTELQTQNFLQEVPLKGRGKYYILTSKGIEAARLLTQIRQLEAQT